MVLEISKVCHQKLPPRSWYVWRPKLDCNLWLQKTVIGRKPGTASGCRSPALECYGLGRSPGVLHRAAAGCGTQQVLAGLDPKWSVQKHLNRNPRTEFLGWEEKFISSNLPGMPRLKSEARARDEVCTSGSLPIGWTLGLGFSSGL